MAQEPPSAKVPWWELPRMPIRPQYLKLQLMMQERQPAGSAREAELQMIKG